jgi:hypothetical protein
MTRRKREKVKLLSDGSSNVLVLTGVILDTGSKWFKKHWSMKQTAGVK